MAKAQTASQRLRSELNEQARINLETQRQNSELNHHVDDLRNQLEVEREERQREREQQQAEKEQERAQMEQERDRELKERQIELDKAKQSMMDEVRQSVMTEVMQMMGGKETMIQEFPQENNAPRNGNGNRKVPRSLFQNTSMISSHQLIQAAKNHRRPPSEKDVFE